MKVRTWILIADGARAHIVENDGIGKGVQPVAEEDDRVVREPTREIGSDRPGRSFASAGGSRRFGFEPRVDWHTYEKQQFAEKMAKVLDAAAAKRRFDRLVLVAPPAILGVLRAALDEQTRKHITAELGKDLTAVPIHELPDRLKGVLNL